MAVHVKSKIVVWTVIICLVLAVVAYSLASMFLMPSVRPDRGGLDQNLKSPAPLEAASDVYPSTVNYTVPDVTNWLTYRNDEFGFEFKHPQGILVKATLVTRPIVNTNPEVPDGPQPLFPYIEVEVNNAPGSKDPPRYYSFAISFTDTPVLKDTSSDTYVSAFPGQPIDLNGTTQEITERLITVFLDAAYPVIVQIGGVASVQFYALDDTFGYFPLDLVITPVDGERFSHLLYTLNSGYGGNTCDKGRHIDFLNCITAVFKDRMRINQEQVLIAISTFRELRP